MSLTHFCGNYCTSSAPRTRFLRQRSPLRPRTTPLQRVHMSWDDSQCLLSKKNYPWVIFTTSLYRQLKRFARTGQPPRTPHDSITDWWLHRRDFVHPITAVIINRLQRLQLKRRPVHEGQHLRKEYLDDLILLVGI